MSFIFGDGFDCYTQLTDCGSYWDAAFGGVTLAISATGRFAGSRGIAIAASSLPPYITKTSGVNDAVHHISVALQQTFALSGISNGMFFTFYDGATAQCTVALRSDGAIVLLSGAVGSGTTLATYTGAVAAINTWYQFEIEVVINNATGSISVRRNGNTSNDFSLGSLNTRASANNYANKVGVGNNWNSPGSQIADDFLWRSDASSVPWIGDVRCYTRMPAADSAVQFTRSGSVVPVVPFVQQTVLTSSTTAVRYTPFIATCSGAVGSIGLSVAAVYSGNAKCTLFSDSSGLPGAVLGSATPLSTMAIGNNTFTFGTPVAVTQGVKYWVGFAFDTGATNVLNVTNTGTGTYGASGYVATLAYASFPAANPAVSPTTGVQCLIFTVNITPTTAANANLVAEVVQDGAAGYVFDATVGDQDLYTLQAIGGTPSSIVAVTTRAYAQKSDAGTRNIGVQLKSGATTSSGTSSALNTSFSWVYRSDTVDPNTSLAWDATGVNNLLVGIKTTA